MINFGFLKFLSTLRKIILRSFVDIYANDTTVYEYTYKTPDKNLAAYLSSDLVLAAQR